MVKSGRDGGDSGSGVRRRHRTWVLSMISATCAWGIFWSAAIWARVSDGWAPSVELTYWISTPLAAVGFAMAILTIRGQRGWLLFVSVPLFANSVLLILPILLPNAGGLHGR